MIISYLETVKLECYKDLVTLEIKKFQNQRNEIIKRVILPLKSKIGLVVFKEESQIKFLIEALNYKVNKKKQ